MSLESTVLYFLELISAYNYKLNGSAHLHSPWLSSSSLPIFPFEADLACGVFLIHIRRWRLQTSPALFFEPKPKVLYLPVDAGLPLFKRADAR